MKGTRRATTRPRKLYWRPASCPCSSRRCTASSSARARAAAACVELDDGGGRDDGGRSAGAGGRGDHARPQGHGRAAVAAPSPTLSPRRRRGRAPAAVVRYAAELSSLVAEKAESARQLEGLVQETRAHAQKYGAVNKELEAALLEFIEDHAEPALRAARRAKDAVEEASQTTTMTRRKLAENSRVLCGWHDDAWSDDEALSGVRLRDAVESHGRGLRVAGVVFDGGGLERVKGRSWSVFVPRAFKGRRFCGGR